MPTTTDYLSDLVLHGYERIQMPLPGFQCVLHTLTRRKALGNLGEATVRRALEAAGYQVSPGAPGAGDLRVVTSDGEIVRVEVKTARRGADGKWRFLLRSSIHSTGKTDIRHSNVAVLLAVLDDARCVAFVVPTAAFAGRPHAVITSDPRRYSGWLSAYRVAPGDALLLAV